MGIPKEQIVDQQGKLNPEYEQPIKAAIEEVNKPEFWTAYSQDPDGVTQQYIQSKDPQAAQMAKKGAKLKKLQKSKSPKKCSCGCALTTHKEGGKLVSKCSCGCKA